MKRSKNIKLFIQVLGHPRWSQQKWSVESVHSKNVISILHLLVALARHFRAPVRLPENVAVGVVVVQVMYCGHLTHPERPRLSKYLITIYSVFR